MPGDATLEVESVESARLGGAFGAPAALGPSSVAGSLPRKTSLPPVCTLGSEFDEISTRLGPSIFEALRAGKSAEASSAFDWLVTAFAGSILMLSSARACCEVAPLTSGFDPPDKIVS